MPAPAWEDLDEFLDTDEFAVSGVIHFQAGDTRQVRGVFDDPYLNAELGEYDLDTSRPRLTGKETDFDGVDRGDYIIIEGVTYDIMSGAQSDGTGMAILELVKQS